VLFMLGLLGFMLLNARELERHFKENVKVDIYLKRDLREVDLMKFRKQLDRRTLHAGNALCDRGRSR
jgi:cell division transport system permease protein